MIRGRTPRRASWFASISPVGPAPTISTSASMWTPPALLRLLYSVYAFGIERPQGDQNERDHAGEQGRAELGDGVSPRRAVGIRNSLRQHHRPADHLAHQEGHHA